MQPKPEFTPWPCANVAQYPLSDDWNDYFPAHHLSRIRYVNIVQTLHALFLTPAMSDVYTELRDYAWQQGGLTNANALDKEFFFNILTHDYPFLLGHRGREIQTSFNLNPKKCPGLGHLRASHFDLYQVKRSNLGFAELKSIFRDGLLHAFFSVSQYPREGEYVFARIVPVGMMPRRLAYTAVEPWDTVDPQAAPDVIRTCREQFDHFKSKYPQTDARAFCKVAAYFMYECIQSYELIAELNADLRKRPECRDESVCAVTTRFAYEKPGHVPAIGSLPDAEYITENGKKSFDLATAPIAGDETLPQTLREAIISRDKNSIEITTFLRKFGEDYIRRCLETLPRRDRMVRHTQCLDNNTTYRALRHLYLADRSPFN